MDEENAVSSTSPSTNTEIASCSASLSTVAVKNSANSSSIERTGAQTAIFSNDDEKNKEYIKKVSIGSTCTPEHVHMLGLQSTPHSPATSSLNHSGAITTTSEATPTSIQSEKEEVLRLRLEAEAIKAEQLRLQEEIRQAKLKKQHLEQQKAIIHSGDAPTGLANSGGGIGNEDDDEIEIYCDNPLEDMSAITEEQRTLVLEKREVDVMSAITEARTEARHFDHLRKRRYWIGGMGVVLVLIVVASVVGSTLKKHGVGGGDNSSSATGESSENAQESESAAAGPNLIDIEDEVASTAPSTYPTKVHTETNEIDSDDFVGTSPTLAVTARPTIFTDEIISTTSPAASLGEMVFPTPSPNESATASPVGTAIYATKVKIQSNSEAILNVFEVQVLDPSGVNVALGKDATQSSTWEENLASYAVDESMETFSSTLAEEGAWWQVDLGESIAIDTVTILNRWCIDESDPLQCLNRLSDSTLYLLDENDGAVATRYIEDTAGVLDVTFQFDGTDQTEAEGFVTASLPPSDSPMATPTTIASSTSPIQTPATPSPVQSCSSDEAILSIFFVFGADPSGVSWRVVEPCTEDIVAECYECYLVKNIEPYASIDHHICLPMTDTGYAFYFEDTVGAEWPASSGYAVVFDGETQNVSGDGGSLSYSTLSLGADAPCSRRSIPTFRPTEGSTQVATTFHDLPYPYPYPYPRFTQWDVLSYSFRANAERLGYNKDYWDNPRTYELEYYPFSLLNTTQQLYIQAMGLTEEQWDCYVNHYESFNWDSLPDFARQSLVYLGWTQCAWEYDPNCPAPASESSNWRALNATEKEATYRLCWHKSSWDNYPLPWA